jgi:hypothetical protein
MANPALCRPEAKARDGRGSTDRRRALQIEPEMAPKILYRTLPLSCMSSKNIVKWV